MQPVKLVIEHSKTNVALFLLGGGRLAGRCRTDDLLPSVPISCLPPYRMDPKVLRLNILFNNILSKVVRGRPRGLLQSVRDRSGGR